jgi:hypothetical protein
VQNETGRHRSIRACAAILAALALSSNVLHGQFDQPFVIQTESVRKVFLRGDAGDAPQEVSAAQFLAQGGLQVTSSTPKVSIQALTYYLRVGEHTMVPFYLATTLPTVSDTTLQRVAEALEDEYGGLANAALGYVRRLQIGKLFPTSDADQQLGLFLDGRVGVRVDDVGDAAPDLNSLQGFGYGLLSVKVALGVFHDKAADSRAGTMTLGGALVGLHSLKNEVHFASAASGFRSLGYVSGALSLFITDVLSLRVGKTFATTEGALPERWFVGASFIPPPRLTNQESTRPAQKAQDDLDRNQ